LWLEFDSTVSTTITVLTILLVANMYNCKFSWGFGTTRVGGVVRYLLVIANISSDVLGFFMVSLRIKDKSVSPFLKNMIIDLSSTFRIMFLLLQKC
jgi:hypothetical protein